MEVKPRTLRIYLKVCDEFAFELLDDAGNLIVEQDDGYVPGFMPGEHYGDYVDLSITNWRKPDDFAKNLQDYLDEKDEG